MNIEGKRRTLSVKLTDKIYKKIQKLNEISGVPMCDILGVIVQNAFETEGANPVIDLVFDNRIQMLEREREKFKKAMKKMEKPPKKDASLKRGKSLTFKGGVDN